MDKINILYLTATLDVGGAEWVLYLLAKGLNRQRYNPIVGYYFWSGKLEDLLRRKGIEVVSLGPGKDKSSRRDRFRSILRLSKFLREKEIKIVHTFQFDVDILGAIASKLGGVPVVISHMQGESFLNWLQKYRLRYKFILNFFIDKYIICSKNLMEKFISGLKVDERKALTLQNVVDEERFDFRQLNNTGNRLCKELGLNGGEGIIGCVANFSSQKGQRYLIDAFSKVKFTFPKTKLLLAGKPSQIKDGLIKQAKTLGLFDDVIFLDFQLNIAEILNLIDIFVLPSLGEGLPIAILEAMYMGKPVIATDVGGIVEVVVDGETGILVPPRNSELLAEAIISLLTDKKKAQDMGRKGKERCLKEFNSNKLINEVENLYESLLMSKGLSKL